METGKRLKYELSDCIYFILFKVNFPYALSFPFAIPPNLFQNLCICTTMNGDFYCARMQSNWKREAVVRKPIRWSEWTQALRIPPGIIDGFSHSGASRNSTSIIPFGSARRKSIGEIYHLIDICYSEFYAKLMKITVYVHPVHKNHIIYVFLLPLKPKYLAMCS